MWIRLLKKLMNKIFNFGHALWVNRLSGFAIVAIVASFGATDTHWVPSRVGSGMTMRAPTGEMLAGLVAVLANIRRRAREIERTSISKAHCDLVVPETAKCTNWRGRRGVRIWAMLWFPR